MTDAKQRISLLHISDTHIMVTPEDTLLGVKTAYYFGRVLECAAASSRQFDLCLVTGDLAQDPYRESYQYLLSALQNYYVPSVCLPGNHDDFGIMQEILSTEKVNCRKRTVLGNWQIINLNSQILDSSDGYLEPEELTYLENSLTENPELFTLIAVHHNFVPCGSGWIDVMMIKNAEEFKALINRFPQVKVVINGHIHQAMDIEIDEVKILSTPSTCFQFKPQTESFSLDDLSPGYRWIDLYPDGSIETEVMRITEKLLDLDTSTQGY